MVAVIFAAGVLVQVVFDRRFGVPRRRPDRAAEQAAQQATRAGLGGFGPGGSPNP